MCRKTICLAFSLLLVAGLADNASAEIPRDPNLVIYYPYEDVGAIVPDESGRGHHGTVVGDVYRRGFGLQSLAVHAGSA